jgi:hypothetical protein
MQPIEKRLAVLFLALALVLGAVFTLGNQGGTAAPDGQPQVEQSLNVTNADRVRRVELVDGGLKTMAGANTPVAGQMECGLTGTLHKAEVQLTGGMGGTNPTLAILWQNSIDRGNTWTNVGTWTQINATVTPQAQAQTVADLVASTAVAYGDCWRAVYTFGGTGTVTADFAINHLEK